jgi:hypothetical protein
LPYAQRDGNRLRADAQRRWDEGYTHYFLTIDTAHEDTAHILQWVETVGWRLRLRVCRAAWLLGLTVREYRALETGEDPLLVAQVWERWSTCSSGRKPLRPPYA